VRACVCVGGGGGNTPIHHRFGKCFRLGKLFSDLSGNCFVVSENSLSYIKNVTNFTPKNYGKR
jgi:hypothetical protein